MSIKSSFHVYIWHTTFRRWLEFKYERCDHLLNFLKFREATDIYFVVYSFALKMKCWWFVLAFNSARPKTACCFLVQIKTTFFNSMNIFSSPFSLFTRNAALWLVWENVVTRESPHTFIKTRIVYFQFLNNRILLQAESETKYFW